MNLTSQEDAYCKLFITTVGIVNTVMDVRCVQIFCLCQVIGKNVPDMYFDDKYYIYMFVSDLQNTI